MESPAPASPALIPELVRYWRNLRNSVTFKLFSMLFLLMIAMIPVAFVQSLIYERQSLQQQAASEINQKWAGQQTLAGPVLTLPYRKTEKINKQTVTTTAYLHLLPSHLKVNGDLAPQTLNRGIYRMVVYNSHLKLNGHFEANQFNNLPVADKDILWNKAFVSIGIPDLRGITDTVYLKWGNTQRQFDPGTVTNHLYESGVNTPVPLDEKIRQQRIPFQLDLRLKGNQQLYITPVGKTTEVAIKAPWPDPSFDGAFLPADRKVSPQGFEAQWKVLHLNRNFPQIWQDTQYSFEGSTFGVHLLQTVDHYTKVTRSVKYALFFIGLTFLLFFLVEVVTGRMVHPLQYLLIGLALSTFYTLLLSMSEHLGFDKAYAIASGMTIGLITAYAAGFLRSTPLAAVTGGTLVSLYGFIYVILNQQDYALLMGSIGLFVVLALVMFFSRKLEQPQAIPS